MEFNGNTTTNDQSTLSTRKIEVLQILNDLNRKNQHKMNPIPICKIKKK